MAQTNIYTTGREFAHIWSNRPFPTCSQEPSIGSCAQPDTSNPSSYFDFKIDFNLMFIGPCIIFIAE